MNQMVPMVIEKKVSGSIWTLTRAAVREKSSRMATMLTTTRIRSRTLQNKSQTGFQTVGGSDWWSIRIQNHLWRLKFMESKNHTMLCWRL